jgi:hypothetical protein
MNENPVVGLNLDYTGVERLVHSSLATKGPFHGAELR